jgi:hypothetical protein
MPQAGRPHSWRTEKRCEYGIAEKAKREWEGNGSTKSSRACPRLSLAHGPPSVREGLTIQRRKGVQNGESDRRRGRCAERSAH